MTALEVHSPEGRVHRDGWLRAGWWALWAAGLAAAVGLIALSVTDESLAGHHVSVILSILVAMSFMASGLIAWRRRPANRLGPLMVMAGFTWLLFNLLKDANWSPAFTLGMFGGDSWVILLVLVLVAFPDGRLTRTDLLLALPFVVALVLPLGVAWFLFVEFPPPGNAILAWPDPAVADAIDTVQRVVLIAGSLFVAAVLAVRWRAASPPLRRRMTPVLLGAATLVITTGNLILQKLTGRPTPEWIDIVVLVTLIGVPVAVLVDMLRARLARSGVAELVVALRASPAPADLREALARALGDPSLTLAYWLPEYGRYADLEGHPVELPADLRRVTSVVDRTGTPVAALLHDPSLRDDPELLDSVGAAAGIALENARLHADLLARVEELRTTRARIVEAAHSERRRLERDLHDGAQQRLVALSLELGLLGRRLDADPAARSALEQARHEVSRSLTELRDLARGIHPAVVTGHGLQAALEDLVARSPVPVRLAVRLPAARLPEPVEVAAYFLVSESLTNVTKYAHASAATVDVTRSNGALVVEVADDGVGGAREESGSGLRGLVDRVEALGGTLRVTSPVGEGTCVHAEIPCA